MVATFKIHVVYRNSALKLDAGGNFADIASMIIMVRSTFRFMESKMKESLVNQ